MSADIPFATVAEIPGTTTGNLLLSHNNNSPNYNNTVPEPSAPTMEDIETTDRVSPASSSSEPTVGTPPQTASSSPTAYSFTGSDLSGKKENPTATPTSGETTKTTTTDEATKPPEEEKMDDSIYECNICLDTAKDAVVSLCGHLFCWPCLHQWLEIRPNRKLCPVCKSAISQEKVIPLYGRNSTKQEDPRNKVPPRPAGQRSEPEAQFGFQGFPFGDGGFHMSFGIGAFPFGFFSSTFNIGEQRPAANRGTTQYENEQQLSQLFLYLAFLCIVWLLFA